MQTTTDANCAVASSFSGSSADLNNLNCLSSFPVTPMFKVADDLPVVSLPAVVLKSKVYKNNACAAASSVPHTYCWRGLSNTKAVVSSLFAGVIVAL